MQKVEFCLNQKKLFNVLRSEKDKYQDQRGYLHNVIVALIGSGIIYSISPQVGIVVLIAWLGHLFLDAIDGSIYWPFYPYKKIKIKGFIDYFSLREVIFDLLLIILIILTLP